MKKIAIILPAYNEELTIAGALQAFHAAMPDAELWVVNNNCTDDTEDIARSVLKKLGAKGGVLVEPRRGKGNAVRRAFHEINADLYVLVDADLTYPANRIGDLIQPIVEGQADMVVGDRHTGGHYKNENTRSLHGFGNKLVRMLINTLFRANLRDIMSGYRATNRKFVKNYPILVEGFEVETDMTLHALDKRFRIIEIPIEYKNRPSGSISKLNTLTDGAKVLFTIGSILRYYRPLLFFGALAVIFFLLGLLTATPVFEDWLLYRYIYHVPLAVLSVALELMAAISLAVGLILDSITRQYKMNFERNLLDAS